MIYQTIIDSFESARKVRASGRHLLLEMTSFMALVGVTSFLCFKDVTNTCKRIRRRVFQCNSGKLEKAEDLCFRFLLVVRIEIDQL